MKNFCFLESEVPLCHAVNMLACVYREPSPENTNLTCKFSCFDKYKQVCTNKHALLARLQQKVKEIELEV